MRLNIPIARPARNAVSPTVETNFLPGRTFTSLEDLNRQALEWSTVRMEQRSQGKAGLIPAKAFEYERSYLTALSPQLPAPYEPHERDTDQYGYVPFQGNYYWVPGTERAAVKLLQYADRVKLFQRRVCVAEYPLPLDSRRTSGSVPRANPRRVTHPDRADAIPSRKSSGCGPWVRRSRPIWITRCRPREFSVIASCASCGP